VLIRDGEVRTCVHDYRHKGEHNYAPAPQEKGAEEPGESEAKFALVKFYRIWLCELCVAGKGGECHSPGCALFLNRAPDIPVTEPMCQEADPHAVPLPLSLVERAVEAGGDCEHYMQVMLMATHPADRLEAEVLKERRRAADALRSVLAELRTYVGKGGR
jgi:hypothetical protein